MLVLPIVEHNRPPLDPKFSRLPRLASSSIRLDYLGLKPRKDLTDCCCLSVERVSWASLEGDRRSLSHAVAVGHVFKFEVMQYFGHELLRAQGACNDASPQTFNAIAGRVGLVMLQIFNEHGRDSIEGSSLILAYS